MPPLSRFGASKYRNATPHVPAKEEWYRGQLPPTSSSGSVTTFSSEVKTTREWVVTLTSGGELSWRSYKGEDVGKAKVGSGTVGDWDVSGLEGGLVAVGSTYGKVFVYALPGSTQGSPESVCTISGSSAVTTVAFHPTTPDVLLVSALAGTVIYNLADPSTPAISLTAAEPKGIWSTAWSLDGTKVAGIGRSGTLYLWSPRSSPEPTVTRTLPIQPIKPARAVFVGEDVFVTAFSRSRNREYHLFSGSTLTTIFTHTLDTSPGLLIPLVDDERKIVYLAARGDMSIRQVELTGPQGYQETIHTLPSQLASASFALAHPSTLPVMTAQVATLLVPQVDKDGDALLPLGVRVPRRQLIDYHDDLYPEIVGTVPEQTADEWLKGGDKAPLLISLDPSRRGVWEKKLAEEPRRTVRTEAKTADAPAPVPTPALASAPAASIESTEALRKPEESQSQSSSLEKTSVASEQQPSKSTDPSLPALEDGETYASTSYKGRIMGKHIAEQLQSHKAAKESGPLMVGLQGPQGCGKTTLCNALRSYLQEAPRNLKIAVLSLDDLYKTNQGLKDIASQHPDNKLLAGRGPPGTHDPQLAMEVLAAVQGISQDSPAVKLPIFDKSLCGGQGDRSSESVDVKGPLDVFILEGWSMGFAALSEDELRQRYESKTSLSDTSYFLDQPLSSLITLNSYLSDFAAQVYPPFSTIVQIEPESYRCVFAWRLEQERNMKKANGGKGMTDEQVQAFVERYMPGYELWKEGVWGQERPWAGKGLRLRYGKDREVIKVEVPESDRPKQQDTASSAVADSVSSPVGVPANGGPARVDAGVKKESVPSPVPAKTETLPAKVDAPIKQEPAPTPKDVLASAQTVSATAKADNTTNEKSTPISSSTKKVSPADSKPFNPGWSRKFLAGKSPLIPSYDQIPALSTLHQDSQCLAATSDLVFFPIQGPGGRIGVHPLKKKGRMQVGGEGYLSGGVEVTDFAVEPFKRKEGTRVALAGEDGVIRVWSVGEDGVDGAAEPQVVLKGKGIDKIAQILFHPTASDLLIAVSNDNGSANIRFFDLATSSESLVTPLEASVFNIALSPDGSRLAAATKDGKIIVMDPRDRSSAVSGKAHDSPRSFQITWLDAATLLSVGFSRGSQRRINLYRVDDNEITTAHSMLIDVSPSVLFPVYDPDTSILYVWGKGERQIQAYEVHPDHATEPIAKLPSFTAGAPQLGLAFFPKRAVDVKKVEVARTLRLTGKTIEEVSFSIPRNKPDFFQDDIYADTLDVETPSTTASDWLAGTNAPLGRISLTPGGMQPLSQAPQTSTQSTRKFIPAKDVLSEQEKKRREMDALFRKAKMDESSDDEPPRSGIDPPDDDW